MDVETLYSIEVKGAYADVEAWTSLIGLEPLQACAFGNKLPNGRVASNSSYWTIGVTRRREEKVDNQIFELSDLLLPTIDVIQRIKLDFEATSSLSIFVWDDECADGYVFLSSDAIKRLRILECDFLARCYYDGD